MLTQLPAFVVGSIFKEPGVSSCLPVHRKLETRGSTYPWHVGDACMSRGFLVLQDAIAPWLVHVEATGKLRQW